VGQRAYSKLQKACPPNRPNQLPIPASVPILRDAFEPAGTQAAYDLALSTRNQHPNESVTDYIGELQSLADKCKFGNFLERAILLRLRSGLREPRLRQKLNSEAEITLAAARTQLKTEEASLKHERQLNLRNPFFSVNQVQRGKQYGPQSRNQSSQSRQ